LAREALPCLLDTEMCESSRKFPAFLCSNCVRRAAVEAAIRKAVEACADLLDGYGIVPGRHPSYYADRIRALLTDKETQ
jgi:hypothetical protein